MPLWVRVVIGVVLFAAGGVWMVQARRKDHATSQEHTRQIHAVLDSVDTALGQGAPSNLGETDAAIIATHFPELARQVSEWDAAASAVATAKERLRTGVASELGKLRADEPPYQFDSIRDGLCAITEARTPDPAAPAQPFPPMTRNEVNEESIFTFYWNDAARLVVLEFNETAGAKGDVLRLQGSDYPGEAAHRYDEDYGRPIYNLLSDMQAWDATRSLLWKCKDLRDFARASLERDVKKERDKTYYRRARGCSGCK
jgi:hypothetical protein